MCLCVFVFLKSSGMSYAPVNANCGIVLHNCSFNFFDSLSISNPALVTWKYRFFFPPLFCVAPPNREVRNPLSSNRYKAE